MRAARFSSGNQIDAHAVLAIAAIISLGRLMSSCASKGDLADEALWTVTCPASCVDGMPQPNRWAARTPGRKPGRPGR